MGDGTAWALWQDLVPRSGALNMAIDQALLERAASAGERWLRLYTWWPHCLSFGRHERAGRRYDRARIADAGIDVVRRPTGGRAVWHGRELTYAVALPERALGGLRAAYLEIHRMVLAALRGLGAEVTLAEAGRVPRLGAGACFAQPVGGEIVTRGRKVVGSAQVRAGGGLLQHGSILLEDDQQLVCGLSLGDAPADGAEPLGRALGRPVGPREVAEAVSRSAAERWEGAWISAAAAPEVLAQAGAHLPRYRSEAWTWQD
jgi:lipoate-protein ligase A